MFMHGMAGRGGIHAKGKTGLPSRRGLVEKDTIK